jgi:hypothetical protein
MLLMKCALNGLEEICTWTVHRSTQRLHSLFTLLSSSTHWHLHSVFRSVCTLPVFLSPWIKVSRREGNVRGVGEFNADWKPYYLCLLPPWPEWNTITCDYLCFSKYNLCEGSEKIQKSQVQYTSTSTGILTSFRMLILQNTVAEMLRINNNELSVYESLMYLTG